MARPDPSERLLRAIRRADARISRFDPLSRILAFDDFDDGANGWCTLIGNHDGDLDQVPALRRDLRPPQISNCSFFDIGTHGSMDGTYALKLVTRPRAGSWSTAMKRLTSRALGRVRFETYFAFKAEISDGDLPSARAWDGNYSPSEGRFGFFTLMNDVWGGADDRRFLCAVRYLNTDRAGNLVRTWMAKTADQPTTRDQLAGIGQQADDLDARSLDDWAPIPGGAQTLCYNETPTKINWHYLSWTFDIAAGRSEELVVNDHVMDLRGIDVPRIGRYESLAGLLNIRLDVRTWLPVRNVLYLDSTVISADW